MQKKESIKTWKCRKVRINIKENGIIIDTFELHTSFDQ